MHKLKDTYLSVAGPASGHLREKGSRFLGFAFPVRDEAAINGHLADLRSEFFDATHHCYAWMLGPGGDRCRAFDDGEPGHSAGDPILGQIRSRSLTHVLVVVVRYYGGTNLGVGGLVKAYRETAAQALEAAGCVTIELKVKWKLTFSYDGLPEVMRFAKGTGIRILEKVIGEQCSMVLEAPLAMDPAEGFSRPGMRPIDVTCERLSEHH